MTLYRRPFLLYFNHSMMHMPTIPRTEFKGKSGQGEWVDCLLELDSDFGEVLDTLSELKIEDNTIVVFSGDNGPEELEPWRGHPGFFDGSYFTGMEGSPTTGVSVFGCSALTAVWRRRLANQAVVSDALPSQQRRYRGWRSNPARRTGRCRRQWSRRALGVAPPSLYAMSGPSRLEWEHSIPAVDPLRYSITLRTLKGSDGPPATCSQSEIR